MDSLRPRRAIVAVTTTGLLGLAATAASPVEAGEDNAPVRSGAVAVAAAVQSSIKVKPTSVRAGEPVRVYGYVRGCPDELSLLSRAFSYEHEFAGVPMIVAKIKDDAGRFNRRTTIPRSRRPGKYSVTGRCGGGNIGARASLRVLRAAV